MSAAGHPSLDELQHARRVAEEVARDAGRLLLEGWGTRARPTIEFKSEDINLVTEFDRRSEALVVSRLAAAFPDDTIVGEEGSEVGPAGAARGRARLVRGSPGWDDEFFPRLPVVFGVDRVDDRPVVRWSVSSRRPRSDGPSRARSVVARR